MSPEAASLVNILISVAFGVWATSVGYGWLYWPAAPEKRETLIRVCKIAGPALLLASGFNLLGWFGAHG